MKCESNYYYDINKTGIGYHGDSERRKVVVIRILYPTDKIIKSNAKYLKIFCLRQSLK